MNFFQHQDAAKKRTSILILLLVCAVICLIAITILAVSITIYYTSQNTTSIDIQNAYNTSLIEHLTRLLQSELSLWIAIGVLSVVMAGSLWKYVQLRQGGKTVAQALGGRPIDPGSNDPYEKRVLNTVEEMAIASGNPVPPVYLIDNHSINAFAAGLSRRDTVIGVTKGCIRLLNRDELQGVIAHEFSHIHNGDMRLNMRLTSILHGILLIGLIGEFVLYSSSNRHSYGSSRNKNGNQLLPIGLALLVIGYAGTFFGGLIKSAVSRQREFLADASAVQFTRNPLGISGALKKIASATNGSVISSRHTEEFSHFFFASGVKSLLTNLMATHPPLKARIKRVEPRWDGAFPTIDENQLERSSETESAFTSNNISAISQDFSSNDSRPTETIQNNETSRRNTLSHYENEAGLITAQSLTTAQLLIDGIPEALHEACHSAFSARAVIYTLLLDINDSVRTKQLQHLKNNAHPATYREIESTIGLTKQLDRGVYLTILNLCIPALKGQSLPQYQIFKRNLIALIRADNKVSTFEWCLYRIVVVSIEEKPVNEHLNLKACKSEATILLAAICQHTANEEVAATAFSKGLDLLNIRQEARPTAVKISQIDTALTKLEQLKPLEKPKLLKALAEIIKADDEITFGEQELFRAIADTLNCPIPPLSA